MAMDNDIENPADDFSISDANAKFARLGYTAQFAAEAGATVRCFTCKTDSPANTLTIVELQRTEGASDPDDMVANVAVACPNCGAKGVLTLKYGPDASIEDQDVLKSLETEN